VLKAADHLIAVETALLAAYAATAESVAPPNVWFGGKAEMPLTGCDVAECPPEHWSGTP
jgi:hypothetical protein